MEMELNELDDKEELLNFFNVNEFSYKDFEVKINKKFVDLRSKLNNTINEMESLMIKKIQYESKEFRLKSIFKNYENQLDLMKGKWYIG